MKHIQKTNEPATFIKWKQSFRNKNGRNPHYKDLNDDKEQKNQVKEALLEEQGYICCYCCNEVSKENSHIEHLKPKGNTQYNHLDVDYGNLLASCQGPNGKQDSCGHRKQNEYD